MSTITSSANAVIKKVRASRDATLLTTSLHIPASRLNVIDIASESGILTPRALAITELPTEDLLRRLRSREITAVETAWAFIRRASVAQVAVNCLTELMAEEALNHAKFLDAVIETGPPMGPLHGLPISLKEHIGLAGHSLSVGYVAWTTHDPPKQDSELAALLKRAGAVIICRTTEPQSVMHLETSSPLYGVTTNPYNRNLTPGGSSGGESALQAMRGSPLGFGSDIGGSVRCPAANCGLYSLRPTALRLPRSGVKSSMPGAESILGVMGPISSSVAGLEVAMRAVIDGAPWMYDPACVRMPWRKVEIEPKGKEKIRVGVMRWDGVVMPTPTIQRALSYAIHKLSEESRIEIVEYEPLEHYEAWKLIAELYFLDGGATIRDILASGGEEPEPLTSHILGDTPDGNHFCRPHSVREIWDLCARRDEFRKRYLHHWQSHHIDCLLSPVGPSTAPRLGTSKYWGYTSIWNLLDYPSATFPIHSISCDPRFDSATWEYMPVNEEDRRHWEGWDPEGMRGGPAGLQVTGLKGGLDLCLLRSEGEYYS
ncbi:putative amidase [Saitoella complicata NRRL Y-17804]|uniref:putative amidase n=1 Tax=Saitoella complicata (strain BCRC 22490 / CBS 7301 / JCM 7358 / NBRC 10748 / NRRL Y-17804) TaxID=698492 RepID=UPI000867EC2B|nr:putative amidase [Saitoella complicata NRRL Y-17804]ODQ56293.1 putative amidase [Saitoella complicata NRRL Y-17804]